MKILLLEPFFSGSHKQWAESFATKSRHDVEIMSLEGRHWKWRMEGAAVSFAKRVEEIEVKPDLILATDMLDVAAFAGLARKFLKDIPIGVYFHENQLTYPWSPTDQDTVLKRDLHYGFKNYTTAIAADFVLFNSEYHKTSFLGALPKFLKTFPDHKELENIKSIQEKSSVLHLGLDLQKFKQFDFSEEPNDRWAKILWNHRWEYDKNPEDFFDALKEIKERGIKFNLIVLGESYSKAPEIFKTAHSHFEEEIIHWGYTEDFKEYARLLHLADILPMTSNQDFFGISLIEALACNVKPLLPKRLAYPEHFPKEYSATFFYEDQKDLVNRLQRLIFNVGVIRKQEVDRYAMVYDWSNMIEKYDDLLEKIMLQ